MAVMATDQQPTNSGTNNGAPSSPTDGGFAPGWNEEAERRAEMRRNRVQQQATTESGRSRTAQPSSSQPLSEEIEDDEEERNLFF